MFKSLSLFFLSCSVILSSGEELSVKERENLLSKVNELKNLKLNKNNSALKSALSAFRKGTTSDTAALELYLDCHRRILTQNPRKRGGEINDEIGKLRDNATQASRRALRYQLSWLVASIEGAADPDNPDVAIGKLMALTKDIASDSRTLDSKSIATLSKSPYSSTFAKAFDIGSFKPKEWPSSPLDFDGLFWKLVCADLIESGNYTAARSQWSVRLNLERSMIEAFSKDAEQKQTGLKEARPIGKEMEQFIENKAPQLLWKLETALYDAGDERQALASAYNIVERYPEHKSYLQWINWLTQKLSPKVETQEE